MANLDEQDGDRSGEPCKKTQLYHDGGKIYITVGQNFVDLSYSDGADPTKMMLRDLLWELGQKITAVMGGETEILEVG